MTHLEEIKAAVSRLSDRELEIFRTWFVAIDADAWDRQIERDVIDGRLNALADEASDELRHGRRTDL